MTDRIRRTASRHRALLVSLVALAAITGALMLLRAASGASLTRHHARAQLAAVQITPRPLPGVSGPTTASGTLTASGQNVSLLVGDQGTVSCQVTGTWSATLIFEGTVDNANWATIHANALASDTLVTAPSGDGIFILGAGMTAVRVRCTAYTSGTAVVTLRATPNTSAVLPVSSAGWGTGGGGGGGGAVTIADGADVTKGAIADAAVTGDNNGTVNAHIRGIDKTLTAGIGVTSLPALPTGANAIGTVGVTSLPALPTGANAIGTVGVTSLPAIPTGSNVIGAVTQSGTWNATVNTALPAGSNTIGTVNVGTPFPAAAAIGDATATPTTTQVNSFPMTWNGASWDRWKDAAAANNQAGYTGIGAVNLSVLDTVNSQMRRTMAASSAIAGGLDGTHSLSVGPLLYTGSTFVNTKGNSDGSLPVGGFTTVIQTSPTITAGAYTAGQDIGGAISFAGATRLSAGTGVIQSVTISDKAKQSSAIDVIFFNAAPTAPTDHTTFAPSSADIAKIIGIVSVTASNYSAFSANSTASVGNVGIPFTLTSGTTLSAVAVSRGTPTYASTSDLQISCGIAED